ncbi:MAG: 3-isopropylmalate dehydrogenase [Bacteroidota bacterium]
MRTYHLAWLPGDGIGPAVTAAALDVLHAVTEAAGVTLQVTEHPVGGAGLDAAGDPLPPATEAACLAADATFLGAVGGPAWTEAPPSRRPEQGLLRLRQALGAFANLRPVQVPAALVGASPLRAERVSGTDLLIVRELTGGLYFGASTYVAGQQASSTMAYTAAEIQRIGRVAFDQARARRGQVTSVDKANVLAVSRLWRSVITELHRREYPDLTLEHLYVDNAAMQLVQRPASFDVVVTANLFGDILSDLAATLPGSLGVLPSASFGGTGALFEPVHGSAPDLAGQDQANPMAALLSGALLLDHLGERALGQAVRTGVGTVLAAGHRTADLVQPPHEALGTHAFAKQVRGAALEALQAAATPS